MAIHVLALRFLLKIFFSLLYLTIGVIVQIYPSITQAKKFKEKNFRTQAHWIDTTSEFKLVKNDIANLRVEGTVLGLLITENNKALNELLEDDNKILISFSIKYEAPVKLQKIKQLNSIYENDSR